MYLLSNLLAHDKSVGGGTNYTKRTELLSATEKQYS